MQINKRKGKVNLKIILQIFKIKSQPISPKALILNLIEEVL